MADRDLQQPSSPENVRRRVRRAVHRACLQRHPHNEGGCEHTLDDEIAAFLAADGVEPPSNETLKGWIDDDKADFDRALLVSELIAQRTTAATPGPAPRPRPVETPAVPPAFAPVPAPAARANSTRSIADLLDDMLAQPDAR